MNGIIGKKIGMTSFFDDMGKNIPCTVIEAKPNVVTQIKSEDTDGYNALQLGYGDKRAKNTSKAMIGHFKKSGGAAKRKLVEFELDELEKGTGDKVTLTEVFDVGDYVNVIGTSKGKGFQGVVKRHGFRGVGDRTHGQHNRERAPGAIGACATPSKVIKGMKMGGQDGGRRVKTTNLRVVKIFADKNLILIKGCVPGHKGSYVIIQK